MPGGSRWSWRGLAVDRLHTLDAHARGARRGARSVLADASPTHGPAGPDDGGHPRRQRRAWRRSSRRRCSRRPLKTPEALAPYLAHLEAGSDAFATERDAQAIEARLGDLGAWLRGDGQRPAAAARPVRVRTSAAAACGTDAAGGGAGAAAAGRPSRRQRTRHRDDGRARASSAHLRRLVADTAAPNVTEFLVTSIDPVRAPDSLRTDVRAEIVGHSPSGAPHVARRHLADDMAARRRRAGRSSSGRRGRMSPAGRRRPLFREITGQILDRIEPGRRVSSRRDSTPGWRASTPC